MTIDNRMDQVAAGDIATIKTNMITAYKEAFPDGAEPQVYFAPGRVNLIGEHTDYNGGHVFPCALSIGTYAAVSKRADRKLRFYSLNFPKEGVLLSDLEECVPGKDTKWIAYPKGVIWAFTQRGLKLDCGLDICIWGNIPNGSGLSSSASLEVLTGYFLRDLYGFALSNIDLALIGQYSENRYNGMNCGIMDQFASAMGKQDQAIFLDTADLSYEYAPVSLAHHKIVITNSKVKHKLVDSQYNVRRQQCEEAVALLSGRMQLKALGELSFLQLEANRDLFTDEILWKRAKHAVTENERTILAVEALKAGRLEEFGQLMNQSHISLRDDYEVSCEEIDVLVEEAWKVEGVLGSRITGGGFGGCTVSIVENGAVENFQKSVGEAYKTRLQREAEFYIVEIGNGPAKL